MGTPKQKIVALVSASILAVSLSACGDVITGKDHDKETAESQPSAEVNNPVQAPDDDTSSKDSSGPSTAPQVTGGFGETPTFKPGSGKEATKMDIKVLTEGSGKAVNPGDTVKVNYEGVTWDGKVFDSSFQKGKVVEFPLNGVIEGWKNGIPGHKVGSRLLMVIPPEQAYGPAGSGHELSGKTLTFVVDILDAQS